MLKTIGLVLLLLLCLSPEALGKTYKTSYPDSCDQLWKAVTVTLGNAEQYDVHEKDDAKMTASYQPKHTVHTNISGAILQRTNKVTLVPKGEGCEMQVVSNYSGWEHNDRGDFQTRVEAEMAKIKPATPAPVMNPDPAAK